MVNTNISESEKIAANTRVEKIVIKFEPPCSVVLVLVAVNVGPSEMALGQFLTILMVTGGAALCGLYQMDWFCLVAVVMRMVVMMTLSPLQSWLQLMERSDRCLTSNTGRSMYLHNNIIINCMYVMAIIIVGRPVALLKKTMSP